VTGVSHFKITSPTVFSDRILARLKPGHDVASKRRSHLARRFPAALLRRRSTGRPSPSAPGNGRSLARATRSVLSGACALACGYDALVTNPCRDVAQISTKAKRPPIALTADELRGLHQWLSSDKQSVERDLPDLVLFLIATGLRIGEALAVQWAELAWMRPQWRYGDRPTAARRRAHYQAVLKVRGWTAHPRVAVLGGDGPAAAPDDVSGDELARQVFRAPVAGGLRDPSNTLKMMRQAFKHAGFDGVTSHYFGKTVATVMDEKRACPHVQLLTSSGTRNPR
jgi:integrase